MMKNIAIIMTVHNRRKTTLECLSKLKSQIGISDYTYDVYLTDDGCTDGTAEAVKEQFPTIHIIKGDGTLFWNRGMWTAWKEAVKRDYEFYLWLNDDTMLFKNALETLFRVENEKGGEAIVVGSICSPDDSNRITYGGRNKNGLIHPHHEIKSTVKFNGNIVLIPKSVYKELGLNDPFFRHAFGDSDYGMRAYEYGIGCFVTDLFIGTCERHDGSRKCWNTKYDLITRFRYLYSPLGYPPNEVFYYYRKHFGTASAIWNYVTCHLKTLLPWIGIFKR